MKNTVPQKDFKSCANRVFYSGLKLSFPGGTPGTFVDTFADFSVFSASLSFTNILVYRSIN